MAGQTGHAFVRNEGTSDTPHFVFFRPCGPVGVGGTTQVSRFSRLANAMKVAKAINDALTDEGRFATVEEV